MAERTIGYTRGGGYKVNYILIKFFADMMPCIDMLSPKSIREAA